AAPPSWRVLPSDSMPPSSECWLASRSLPNPHRPSCASQWACLLSWRSPRLHAERSWIVHAPGPREPHLEPELKTHDDTSAQYSATACRRRDPGSNNGGLQCPANSRTATPPWPGGGVIDRVPDASGIGRFR